MAASWLRGILRWVERLLFLAGVVALSWVYLTWKEAMFYEIRAQGQLKEIMAARASPPGAVRPSAGLTGGQADAFVGYLAVPRLGLSVPILEGDDERTLRIAAGHLPDTPFPWEEGNTAIAGHRDMFFRPLKDVRIGDEVHLQTRYGDFRYRVLRVAVVGPDDLWVLRPWDGVHLTLLSCYPFNYIGSAPERFIVHAERIVAAGTGTEE